MIYKKEEKIKYTIADYPGEWIIDHSYVTDLGYLMVKFYNLDNKIFLNINLGSIKNIIGYSKAEENN